MSNLDNMKRIGLLGGGQLARMLALRGHSLGLEMHVLSESAYDPAALVVKHHHLGNPNEEEQVRKFLESVDVATFESEFLDSDLLSQVSQYTKTPIFPQPDLMGLIQDRLNQKELLILNKLPIAKFSLIHSLNDAEAALKVFGGKYILKQRRFGYDGYGTFVIDGKRR
jgi:5-(carboxyamino)imidazole ribonucleotide synthase